MFCDADVMLMHCISGEKVRIVRNTCTDECMETFTEF